jgi:hypothetical protein
LLKDCVHTKRNIFGRIFFADGLAYTLKQVESFTAEMVQGKFNSNFAADIGRDQGGWTVSDIFLCYNQLVS